MSDTPQPPSPSAAPRRKMWAALLSLVCPGLGQIYATRVRRGFVIMLAAGLANTVITIVAVGTPSKGQMIALLLVATFGIGTILFAIIDAALCARRERLSPLGRWNRRRNYLAIAVLWIVFTQLAGSVQETRKQYANYSIPATSMAPTLMVGDYVLCWRDYYATNTPSYGDVAVFGKSGKTSTPYIKRVVGLPGDRIQLQNGQLFINGTAAAQTPEGDNVYVETLPNGRSYQVRIDDRTRFTESTPAYTVPAGHYFVLGDNRNNSADSRFVDEFGFIPQANLRDKALFLIWSRNHSRLGQAVR